MRPIIRVGRYFVTYSIYYKSKLMHEYKIEAHETSEFFYAHTGYLGFALLFAIILTHTYMWMHRACS